MAPSTTDPFARLRRRLRGPAPARPRRARHEEAATTGGGPFARPSYRERIAYRRPTPEVAAELARLRELNAAYGEEIEASCPPGTERSRALSLLEDCHSQVVAAVVRQLPPDPDPARATQEAKP